MNENWTATSYSNNSTPVSIDETLARDEVVILLQGKNTFKDQVYCYLKLTLESLIEMKRAMLDNRDFMPGEFGTVLAAGKGEPNAELRSEMAITHKMVDKPAVNKTPQPERKKKPKLGSFTSRIQYSPED